MCTFCDLFSLLISVFSDSRIFQDFDKVWPIFDSAQSRDFRKVIFAFLFSFNFESFKILVKLVVSYVYSTLFNY